VIKAEPVACQSVVDEAPTTLRPLAEKKGIQFRVDVPQDQVIGSTDRRALSQILLNLANNAIKFTEKGEVRLELCYERENGRRARN
jgi:signal transduction histidine kinase